MESNRLSCVLARVSLEGIGSYVFGAWFLRDVLYPFVIIATETKLAVTNAPQSRIKHLATVDDMFTQTRGVLEELIWYDG